MRLQRVGRRNDPSYRVVVVDRKTGPKSNKSVAQVGTYSPKLNHVSLQADEIKRWVDNGVQPSPTVHNLLVKQGIINAPTINPLPQKSPVIDEEAERAKAEAAKAKEAEAAVEEADGSADADDSADDAEAEQTNEAASESGEVEEESASSASEAEDDAPAKAEEAGESTETDDAKASA